MESETPLKTKAHLAALAFLSLLLLSSICFIVPEAKAVDGWGWLNSWSYRKCHVIQHASGAGSNYQTKIIGHYGSGADSGNTIYFNSHARSDFGDVRFTEDDGLTLLSYYEESVVSGDTAVFWVRISDDLSSEDQTIYVYYGAASETSLSDGEATFVFYDDFETDLTKWSLDQGGGTITLTTARPKFGSKSAELYDTSNTDEISMFKGGFDPGDYRVWFYIQFDDDWGFFWNYSCGVSNRYVWMGYYDVSNQFAYYYTTWQMLQAANLDTYYEVQYATKSASLVYDIWIDNTLKKTDAGMNPESPTTERTMAFTSNVGISNYKVWVDEVRVAKIVWPEPQHGSWQDETPVTITFKGVYDEDTGLLKAPGSRAVNVTVNYGSYGVDTFELNETATRNYGCWPTYVVYDLTNRREYWLSSDETPSTLYVFDTDTTSYTISFLDLGGVLKTHPYISAKRLINGTFMVVEKRKADVQRKVSMSLKNTCKYTITLSSETVTYTYGELLMTSSTSVSLTLTGVDFPKETLLTSKWVRIYAYRQFGYPFGSITLNYNDTLDETTSVVIKIKLKAGTTLYTYTEYSSAFSHTWPIAANYTNYKLEATVTHETFGTYTWVQWFPARVVDSSFPFDLSFLGSLPFDTSVILPCALIIFAMGCFSVINAYVGAFLGVATAALLTYIGWIPIPAGALMAAFILCICMGLVYAKRRLQYE